jgi:malonate transporter and related proteins
VLMALADRDARGTSAPQRSLRAVLWGTLRELARTPMLVAIVLGFAGSVLAWQLPPVLAKTVSLFAQASTAIALFVIGGALVGLRLQGKRTLLAKIMFGKLVLHPLSVWLVLTWVVPISDPQLRTAAVLFAAMPMLGIYPILSYRHGHEDVSAAALLATTVGSFFTLNLLLWALRHAPL